MGHKNKCKNAIKLIKNQIAFYIVQNFIITYILYLCKDIFTEKITCQKIKT